MSISAPLVLLLSKHVLCDHCLGRQIGMLGTGFDNGTRGFVLRQDALLEAHAVIKEGTAGEEELARCKSFIEHQATQGFPLATKLAKLLGYALDESRQPAAGTGQGSLEPVERDDCELCNGLFSRSMQDRFLAMAVEATASIEFSSFVVGSRIDPRITEKEEEMRVDYGLKWGETYKSHFNRFFGSTIGKGINKAAAFQNPDIVILYTIPSQSTPALEIQINPFFIYGKYQKLVRGIPQTHWPHKACGGRGCEECNYTGKQYQESVEELMMTPFIDATGASGIRFHGAGREDIDARMLGEGRPFAVEILNGTIRTVDYHAIEVAINESAGGKIVVEGLRPSTNDEMQHLKGDSPSTRKKYRALCTLERPIDDETLETIKLTLETTPLKQQTPTRVLHRRADKVRIKNVYEFTWERVEDVLEIYVFVESEGGTYIKELISGDDGRTNPSISGIAGQQIVCKELDVLEVQH